jgi:ATP-dependent Zn protease
VCVCVCVGWPDAAEAVPVRFTSSEGVIVIGATNFPELLDKALVRPGRFDRHITVPLPDVRGREQILRLHTKKVPLAADVSLAIVARGTPGFSGTCTQGERGRERGHPSADP